MGIIILLIIFATLLPGRLLAPVPVYFLHLKIFILQLPRSFSSSNYGLRDPILNCTLSFGFPNHHTHFGPRLPVKPPLLHARPR